MGFPQIRLRRVKKHRWSRNIVRENYLHYDDFILAVFVIEGFGIKDEIENMPGVYLYSIDKLLEKLEKFPQLNAIMVFPRVCQKKKTIDARESYNEQNLICRAIRAIKLNFPNIGVITDVALDPYTTHGHDGIIDETGYVLNDSTIEVLCKQAVNQAMAGCDIIAPSDSMDGRIGEIRKALDFHNLIDVQIMSYVVKFRSCFYAPFRDAVGSSKSVYLDKSTYQTDPANSVEVLREIQQDVEEGADYLIVKPAMLYLDIVKLANENCSLPIIAYSVSGEYSMCATSVLEKKRLFYELYISMKRAGARNIITYNIENAFATIDYNV